MAVAERMKHHTVEGHYYFSTDEYLQVHQIWNLISRIKQKKPQQNIVSMAVDDGIEKNLDEICDLFLVSDDEDFEAFDDLHSPLPKDNAIAHINLDEICHFLPSDDEDFKGFQGFNYIYPFQFDLFFE